MNRTCSIDFHSVGLLKLIFVLPLLILAAPRSAHGAEPRPNILLVVSEDNGQELSCYGDPFVKTPELDRLATEGVRFENAYVPQSGCSQSRAALMTGLFPHQNGQIGLATWNFRMYKSDTPNLVSRLRSAGYRTGIIGKLHIKPNDAFPFDYRKLSTSNFDRKQLDSYAKHAEDFFRSDDQPFFLSVNYPDAHRPFLPKINGLPAKTLRAKDVKPLPYFGLDSPELREETANYYNCIQRLDALVGDLLSALKRSGKSRNTMVIYLGDHGADLLRGKRTCLEGGLRIPLIIRWPEKAAPRSVRAEMVSTIDLLPTVLEATRAMPIQSLPGRSLVPLLEGNNSDWRNFLFAEYHLHSAHNFFPQRCVRGKRFKLIHNLMPNQVNPGYDFTMNRFFAGLNQFLDSAPKPVRSAYRLMHQPTEFELYDLEKDPFEFNNLAESAGHAAEIKALKMKLLEWRTRTADPLLNPENLKRLKKEIDNCWHAGKPNKLKLELTYWDYFFQK